MEWIERLNKAINYIEEHLTDEIDYDQIARIACCSTYHFQRMFAYMANVPLSEYIRRRRMSLAAVELRDSETKIIDVALKYGYSSPTAFNRAFQGIHGIPPSAVREEGTVLHAYPPISFKLTIVGAEEMNYRIEKKEPFRIVGVSHPLKKEIEENYEIVPKMWETAAADGTIPQLAAMMDSQPAGILGISLCNDLEQWRYYIAVTSAKSAGEQFEEYTIPSYTWAIFPGQGQMPGAIQELEQRIITEWLPGSGYEYDNGPDVELYINADPQNTVFEVWIPVVRK